MNGNPGALLGSRRRCSHGRIHRCLRLRDLAVGLRQAAVTTLADATGVSLVEQRSAERVGEQVGEDLLLVDGYRLEQRLDIGAAVLPEVDVSLVHGQDEAKRANLRDTPTVVAVGPPATPKKK